MLDDFFRYYDVITNFQNMETKRTTDDWRKLYESVICAILSGRCANSYYGDMSMDSLVDEALMGADLLVERLREREDENSEKKCIQKF